MIVHGGYNYKLTADELAALVPAADAERIVAAAAKRKPGKWARRIVSVALNKAKTVWVQNVQFYGGSTLASPTTSPPKSATPQPNRPSAVASIAWACGCVCRSPIEARMTGTPEQHAMSKRGCEFCSKPFNRPAGEAFTCPYCGKVWKPLPTGRWRCASTCRSR